MLEELEGSPKFQLTALMADVLLTPKRVPFARQESIAEIFPVQVGGGVQFIMVMVVSMVKLPQAAVITAVTV